MFNKICLPILGFLFLSSSAFAAGPYATNAITVVNKDVIKFETAQKPLPPADKAKAMLNEAIGNSYQYNNSEEIEKFVDYVKQNKLEVQFKKELTVDVPAMRNRVKYDIEWSFFKSFTYSTGIGLLDQQEFQSIKNKLIELQKLRFQRSKKENFAKEDLKVIEEFEKKYQNIRAEAVDRNRANCQDEMEWDKSFSPRKGQTDTGWCYAFGLADFLEATIGQKVSAADLVLQYRKIQMKADRDSYNRSAKLYNRPLLTEDDVLPHDYIYKGGELEKITYKSPELSLCSEDDLRSEARDEKGQPVAMGLIIDWINELGERYAKGKISKETLTENLNSFKYKQIFPNADLNYVLKNLNLKNDLYILLAEDTCSQKRTSIQNERSTWIMQGYGSKYSMAAALDKMTSMLADGPVLVSINDNFLYKENIWGKQSNHILLITGKRWNEKTQHCELKIRNSQTTLANKEEKVWYTDTEILRNVEDIFIKPLR